MPETPAPIEDYREAFRRAARPGYDPHQLNRFRHPKGRPRGWLARLHGSDGTLESAHALIEFALALPPEATICTYWPGYFPDNPDFGVVAVGDPDGPGRTLGVIEFRPIEAQGKGGNP